MNSGVIYFRSDMTCYQLRWLPTEINRFHNELITQHKILYITQTTSFGDIEIGELFGEKCFRRNWNRRNVVGEKKIRRKWKLPKLTNSCSVLYVTVKTQSEFNCSYTGYIIMFFLEDNSTVTNCNHNKFCIP